MRLNHVLMVAVSIAAVVGMSGAASAETLALDFQPTGGTTAAGFLAFEESNQVAPSAGTTYPGVFTPAGPTVSLTTANLPDGFADFRAVTRNGTATGEKEIDWLGVDTRNSGVDVTMTVSVAGLPAGMYSWLSTHHDGGSDSTNGNLNGAADYEFIDGNGSSGLVADGITFSEQDEGDPISTFSRSFESDGGVVSFSMIMDNGQGGTDNALFAFVNSVEITLIPEPSSFVLIGAGLAGLAMIRRRK